MGPPRKWGLLLLTLASLMTSGTSRCQAQLQVAAPVPSADEMTIDDAMAWALQNNPELAALRQQYGIAAAEVDST